MAASSSGGVFSPPSFEVKRKRSAPVIHWTVPSPPKLTIPPIPTSSQSSPQAGSPSSLGKPRLRLSILTTKSKSSDAQSLSQGSSAQSRYAYNGHSPTLPKFLQLPETSKPPPCAECAERDAELEDIDVRSPGVWGNIVESDIDSYLLKCEGPYQPLLKDNLTVFHGQTAPTLEEYPGGCNCVKKTPLDVLRCRRLHEFLTDQLDIKQKSKANARAGIMEELWLAQEARRVEKLRRSNNNDPSISAAPSLSPSPRASTTHLPPGLPPTRSPLLHLHASSPSLLSPRSTIPPPTPSSSTKTRGNLFTDLAKLPRKLKLKIFNTNSTKLPRSTKSVDDLLEILPTFSSAVSSCHGSDSHKRQHPRIVDEHIPPQSATAYPSNWPLQLSS